MQHGIPPNTYVPPRGPPTAAADGLENLTINNFLALSERLRLIQYLENFKPAITKYDGCSDPNIWLRTYAITTRVAGGSYDHMAAYYPLVMGKGPLLWLDNLPTRSINYWAALSRRLTSNFQATYSRPSNTHHLGRVTMRPKETLQDYTDWFFENHNKLDRVKDDQVIDYYKKGIKDLKLFDKIH